MAESQQWRGKTAGGNFGQRFLFFALKYVKVKYFYIVLYPVIPFCLLFARKTNHSIYLYFRKIIGYRPWTAFCANVRTAFTFGKVVIDKFALLSGRSDQFEVTLENREIFDMQLQQEKGFILAGSHIGNFELLGHCMKQDVKPINSIVYGGESQLLQSRRGSTFSENHVRLIPIAPDMSHLFALKNALDQGEIVTILCDRLFGSSKKMTIDFMGHPANFPVGAFRLAVQMDIPIISVFLLKGKDNHYTGRLVPLHTDPTAETVTEKVRSLLLQYVKLMEEILEKHPSQWFNFYDFWGLEPQNNNKTTQ